jgi:plastocyanin
VTRLGILLASLVVLALVGAQVARAHEARTMAASPPAQAGAQSWQVQVGGSSADNAVQLLHNYPEAITVNAGDAVTWTNPTPEIHTVTFLAPGQEPPRFDRADPMQSSPQGNGQVDGSGYLNSGVMERGQSWTATAGPAGTYSYVCLVHRNQLGTVIVNDAGTPYPQTQAEYAATAQVPTPIIAEWQARIQNYQPTVRTRDNGTREFVLSGGMGDGIAATMRFIPQSLEVRVGDTVTWDNEDVETPHTVTVGPPQGNPQEPWGNPAAFSGTEPLNSGYFGKNWPLGETYSVTFTAPGQVGYICILHAPAAMIGTITITP